MGELIVYAIKFVFKSRKYSKETAARREVQRKEKKRTTNKQRK